MLTNEYFHPKINNLRVILNCFYIYLIFNTFQYAKKVIFQYPFSISIIYTKIYLIIRSLVGAFCIILYSILVISSLWLKRVGILINSLLLLIIFLIIRLIFDLHGYIIGYFEYSLYPPFELIRKNLTKINNQNKQKQILEEITDFSVELIRNFLGILLTISILIRMIRKKWKRKQMKLENFKNDIIRRRTV